MTIGLKMQKMDVSNLLYVHGFDFDVFFKEFLKKVSFKKVHGVVMYLLLFLA
jgi:hypothetical protein